VGTTEKPEVSRITIVAKGDDQTLEQITKQLYKQIDVLKVFDIPEDEAIERELALIKVKADKNNQKEITKLAENFNARVANVDDNSLTLEVCVETEKLENLQKLLEKFGILEMVRTGKIALKQESFPRAKL